MYKMITTNGHDYKIEFSIEASLYKDCADSVLNTINAAEGSDVKSQINAISCMPLTVLNMFHAGLLEHHGIDGDGAVTSIVDSKNILKSYMKENDLDFDTVANLLFEQMAEDGFFKLIGLDFEMETRPKEVKKPQDHKRKVKNDAQSEN